MAGPRRTLAQQRGAAAERLAENHLEQAGLRTVARNWRCRLGELDLIMRDGATLVFVEVRRRRPGRHGTAAESVGPNKRMRLIRAATLYLQRLPDPPPCRFDIVALDESADGTLRLDWIRRAFDTD